MTRYESYVIPVAGPFGPWGIAFHTSPDDERVRCERCARMLQWPDAAREHVRYHAHIENERARREYAAEQRWHRRRARLFRRDSA